MTENFVKADSGKTWIYLIIMVFWALNAIFEAKRKAKLKRQQQEGSEPPSQEHSDAEELRQAEEAARRAPYQHVPTDSHGEASLPFPEPITPEVVLPPPPVIQPPKRRPAARPILHKQIQRPQSSMVPNLAVSRDPKQWVMASEILGKPLSLRRNHR